MSAAAMQTTGYIIAMLEEGRKAAQAGATSAAYLLIWGAMESALEQATEQSRLPISLLLSYSLNRGVVDRDEYLFLQSASRNRDSIAHGKRQATRQEVDSLATFVQRLSSRQISRSEESTVEPVREVVGGEPYDYFPLGEYIVRAVGVCGGRPTFKYTRIEPSGLLQRLAAGEAFNDIVEGFEGSVSAEALQEAIDLRARPLLDNFAVLPIR